ncbi:MAG: hypothetical protein GC158_07990 [Cyanobacteria bacterium RI_101]|nr:hypothetical protein [Cyanobacteria bacterium RI_101]
MTVTDAVTRLLGSGLQNSYLMTYIGAVREQLAQEGLAMTPEATAQMAAFIQDPGAVAPDSEGAALARKLEDPEFQTRLQAAYKAKMIDVLQTLEIELTPEIISAFKAEAERHPENFARMFASTL